ncbi:MAG: hypothetical protein WCY72_12395 [Lysobacteraceae bacterium]
MRSAGGGAWGKRAVLALAALLCSFVQPVWASVQPPQIEICNQLEGITRPGNTPSTPGLWWNPFRDGTGWQLFYVDDQTLAMAWYTFGGDRKPVWLLTDTATIGIDGQGDRIWQAPLRRYTWDYAQNVRNEGTLVGSVAVKFHHNDPLPVVRT